MGSEERTAKGTRKGERLKGSKLRGQEKLERGMRRKGKGEEGTRKDRSLEGKGIRSTGAYRGSVRQKGSKVIEG